MKELEKDKKNRDTKKEEKDNNTKKTQKEESAIKSSIPWPVVNTPTVLQMEAVECGAASLGMILGYHKRFVPLSELREASGVSRDGSKASNMVKAAELYGLKADGYREAPEALAYIKPPMILHWNFNHFVVLEGIKNDRVYINDPSNGKRIITKKELDDAFTGVVLIFEKGPNFIEKGTQETVFDSLKERFDSIRIGVLFIFFVGLFVIVPGLIIPAVSQMFVDYVIVKGDTSWTVPLLTVLAFVAILKLFLNWLQNRYFIKLREKLSISNSTKFFWHLLKLPTNFFHQRYAGDLSARLSINDAIADIFSGDFAAAGVNIVMVIFYFILMYEYNPVLAIMTAFISFINLYISRYISKIQVANDSKILHEHAKLYNVSISGIRMIESIKASGAENGFFSKWSGHHAKLINYEQEVGEANTYIGSVSYVLNGLNTIFIISLGSFFVLKGYMTVGMLVAFQTVVAGFIGPVNYLISFFSGLPRLKGKFDRLDDVLKAEEDPMISLGKGTISQDKVKLEGYVEIKNLTFGYSRLEPPIIENFDLSLKPGSRVALVGASGSGKSTIAKVLSGLHKEWKGDILFDGVKREKLPRELLKNSIAVIDQNIISFNSTVKENITLWDSSITDKDIVKASEDASIHDVIISKKRGYNYELGESSKGFSGGEMQRIEIARVLSTEPSILIMDEATSALDSKTEELIDRNIRRRGCTCIIVAHRLSTIRDADEIIVLDRGKIIERGTHDQLISKKGAYSTLVTKN